MLAGKQSVDQRLRDIQWERDGGMCDWYIFWYRYTVGDNDVINDGGRSGGTWNRGNLDPRTHRHEHGTNAVRHLPRPAPPVGSVASIWAARQVSDISIIPMSQLLSLIVPISCCRQALLMLDTLSLQVEWPLDPKLIFTSKWDPAIG